MHRRFRVITAVFLFLLSYSKLFAQLPANYQDLSAEQKQDVLWEQIVQSHEKEPLPPLTGKSIKDILDHLKVFFNLKASFDYTSDEMPEGRVKIIHSNGSVGKIVFAPASGHPFTGIYKSGAIGLARLSLAAKPSDTSYIPGMAVKFLIPYHPSLNVHIMQQLEGQQENWNFFANDFTNHIPHATGWILKAIEKIFEWARSPANDLPLWHLAKWNDQGIEELNPVVPEQLYFRASERVKDIIPADSRLDFRISFMQIGYGALYEVYGLYQGSEYHIGTLMLESTLLASNYGDKNLFFQHQR